MKKRLNILCVLVLLVLGWSVIEAGYYLVMGASLGVKTGYAAAEAEAEKRQTDAEKLARLAQMQSVHLVPDFFAGQDLDFLSDSVYNEKSGSSVPASYLQLAVCVDRAKSPGMSAFLGLLGILSLAFCIWALVLFVRLVVAINRSDIFIWRNVRRLRLLGLALLLGYGCSLLSAWLSLRGLEKVFALEGYELSMSGEVGSTALVLGLCSLIVGEVFAIGLRLREDQELTI